MFVDRQAERALLDALLNHAREGSGRSVVVRGDPGIGKTALLTDLAARTEGFRIVQTRGLEAEAQFAFSGLLDLLRPLYGMLERLPDRQRAVLAGALGLEEPVPADPFLLGAATLGILTAAAEELPLLVLVDDAQWVDAASLSALLFAGRRLGADPVAIVFAARERESNRFLAPGIDDVWLRGLDPGNARALLEDAGLAASVLEHVLAVSDGNPLALVELPRVLSEEERIGARSLPDIMALGDALQHSFDRQFALLSDPCRQALLVAAAEPSAGVGVVQEGCRLRGLGRSALAEAEEAGLITYANGTIAFRHPLIRSAAYHAAAPPERRATHAALAACHEALEQPSDRAWHLAAATLGPDREVAAALEAAGQSALAHNGHASAAAAFEKAGVFSPDQEERARRLFLAGRTAYGAGLPPEVARRLLASAADDARAAELRFPIQRLRIQIENLGQDPEIAYRLGVAEGDALSVTHPQNAAILFASAGYIARRVLDLPTAVATHTRARELARNPDGSLHAIFDVLLGTTLLVSDRIEEALPLTRRAPDLLDEFDSAFASEPPEQTMDRLAAAAEILLASRDLDRLGLSVTLLDQRCRRLGLRFVGMIASAFLGSINFWRGDWVAARARLTEAEMLAATFGVETVSVRAEMRLAELAAAQGDEVETCRRVGDLVRLDRNRQVCDLQRGAQGLLVLGQRRYEEARHIYAREVVPGLARSSLVLCSQAADAIEAHIRVSAHSEVADLHETFTRQARQADFPWALAAAAHLDGLLAREDTFEQHFAESLSWHEQAGEPFRRARTLLAFGERLRRARRRRDARAYLREALDVFERLGASPWAAWAGAELRATGERVRTREASRDGSLTPQELQIALVVAGGATNREAAQQFFISPKTIEKHLGSVYLKLGVRSRTELARVLGRDKSETSGR